MDLKTECFKPGRFSNSAITAFGLAAVSGFKPSIVTATSEVFGRFSEL